MNIILTVFGACVCSVLVSPVSMHYLYTDNPGTGFVTLNNGGHNYPVGFTSKQHRYLGNSNVQTFQRTTNEQRTVVSKATVEPAGNDNRNFRSPANHKVTEPPKRQQKKDERSFMHDLRNLKASREKSLANQNYRSIANARNKEYKPQMKQYDQNYNLNKGNVYDSKGNILQMNVHKTPIPAEPQKVKLNSNRQLTALSVQRREDNYKRMPTSMLVDKTLNGGNFKERNAQIMSRVLDDMTIKVADRRVRNNDYKKRDTLNAYDIATDTKRNVASDSLKKYIGKEMNMKNLSPPKETAIVVTHEEEKEENNAPYALFYRMNPESLDNQDGFFLMKTMENDGDKVFSIKQKRLSVNFENEVDLKKTKSKKNFNTIKLRNKVKNIASFRNSNF